MGRAAVGKEEPAETVPSGAHEGLNSTAFDLFEKLRRDFEKSYAPYGRIPTEDPPANALTLDFEFETDAYLKLTPEILLQRGLIDTDRQSRSSKKSSMLLDVFSARGLAWPTVSKWFTVGLDGSGRKNANGEWRQTLRAVVELESSLMSPKEVIEGSMPQDIQDFLEDLHAEKRRQGEIFRMPFEGSSGLRIDTTHLVKPRRPCSRCFVHWTAGLSLEHVPNLLRNGTDPIWQQVVASVDSLCSKKVFQGVAGCPPEYHAFLTLAVATLRKVQGSGCGHPKRGMKGWLVRTHFGDLAFHLRDKFGMELFESIPGDILAVGSWTGDESVLPDGIIDYLRLPEFAEVAGLVSPRSSVDIPAEIGADRWHTEPEAQDIPTAISGLLELSDMMRLNSGAVNQRLKARSCHLHNGDKDDPNPRSLTVQKWLDGLQDGKDLMSDHDSELSKSSFSHLVWKSMGSWRMKPGSDRIYLECRRTKLCLQNIKSRKDDPGPGGLMRIVGERMLEFEKDMKKRT